jgi:hypothetical protein
MNRTSAPSQPLELVPMDEPSRAPDVTATAPQQPVAAPPSRAHASIARGESSALF